VDRESSRTDPDPSTPRNRGDDTMRRILAAAASGVVALAGFAGVADASATIDLIWNATGTKQINDSAPPETGPYLIRLNVILTAGPAGSQGAGVSVDFSSAGAIKPAFFIASNTPSVGNDSPLPLAYFFPTIGASRVELINSICLCDSGVGTGLAAGQSHQLGTVTFNIDSLPDGDYEFRSDADYPSDGILDGAGNDISDTTTFNDALLVVPEPAGWASLKAGMAMLALLYRRRRFSAGR
jgi:hypothetical protein